MNRPPRPAVFVEVAVPLPIDHPFTYRVPAGGEARAKVGVRALVPFGARRVTGLVTALSDGAALGEGEAKEVLDFLDEEPYIPPGHLAFLLAAARECLAPAGEMLRAALPRGASRRGSPPSPPPETLFRPANGNPDAAPTPKQRKVYSLVLEAEEIASADLSARISRGGEVARRFAARGVLSATVPEKTVGLA